MDHKSKSKSEAPTLSFPAPGDSQGRVSWFQALFATTAGILGLILLPATTRAQIRMLWGEHVPRLALAIANMIDAAPELFSWVPWSAARFRETAALIHELSEIQAAEADFATRLNDTLLFQRSELFRAVRTVGQGLLMTLDSPATDPALRGRLLELSTSVRALLNERTVQLKAARKESAGAAETEGRVAELEAQLAARDEELRGLRGEAPAPKGDPTALSPGAARANRKASRRAATPPRRTRR